MKKHQQKILIGLANGKTPKQISKELSLSANTVRKYIILLREEYEALNATNLIAIALRNKVIQ